jgi:hypothetical protein
VFLPLRPALIDPDHFAAKRWHFWRQLDEIAFLVHTCVLIIASEFLTCSRRHGTGDVSICGPAHVVRLMLYTLACDATSLAIDKWSRFTMAYLRLHHPRL